MPFNVADLKLGLTQFLASNAESLQKFTQVMQTFGKNLRTSSPLTAKSGWFLTWATAFSPHEIDKNNIDAHMTILLEQDWDGLKTALIDSHPTRKDILNEAFLLHEEGRYIASIPLFFSQADGICQDMLQGVGFFSGDIKADKKIIELYELREGESINSMNFLLDPLRKKTVINIKSRDVATPESTPNRHGIMHGDPKHLNYGTKVNSLKAFSFLLSLYLLLDEMELASE